MHESEAGIRKHVTLYSWRVGLSYDILFLYFPWIVLLRFPVACCHGYSSGLRHKLCKCRMNLSDLFPTKGCLAVNKIIIGCEGQFIRRHFRFVVL